MNTEVKKPDPFDAFLDFYLQEPIAMPDEDVLAGLDPAVIKTEAISMFDAARAEAGRRRLVVARNESRKRGFPGLFHLCPLLRREHLFAERLIIPDTPLPHAN